MKGRPGAAGIVFGIVLAMGLVGGRTGFLDDPGTFWHVRLGRDILRTGHVPRVDELTFTRAGMPWVDQSWAFDAGLAWLVDRWGWSAAVAATAVGLAWLYGALARGLERDGNSPLVAAVVAILAASIGSIHFLARPHLFTFAGVLWTCRACRDYHLRGGWSIWSVPLVMVAWANLHGGFLAGPLIVATAAVGHLVSGPLDADRLRRLAGFLAVFGLSLLAPLLNPYGSDLYRHVAGLLWQSGVTELIDEYQPSPFGKGQARVLEWVVLGLVALPVVSRARPSRYDLVQAVVWLHLGLVSVRHAPLFALAAAPLLAEWLDGLIRRPAGVANDLPGPGWVAWPSLASVGLAALVAVGAPLGGLSPRTWPLASLSKLDEQPVAAPLFHEQDWGGLIACACRPARRSYLDDRFELYGKPALLEYINALQGGPDWDALCRRERFGLVWVRPDRKLAERLGGDPAWEVVRRDGNSVLFRRKEMPGPLVARRAGRR